MEPSVLDRALEAAADLVLTTTPPLPALPSSSAICADLGIGASTFYRIFDSVSAYREELMQRLLRAPYRSAEQPFLEALDTAGGVAMTPLEFRRLELELARVFEDGNSLVTAPEADWFPWLRNEAVRRWIEDSNEVSREAEQPSVDAMLERFGVRARDSDDAHDLMNRQIALTVASKMCGIGALRWPGDDEELSLVLAARWRLAVALLDVGPTDEEPG